MEYPLSGPGTPDAGVRRAWLLLHDPFSTPDRAAVHLAGLGAWTVGLRYSREHLPWDFLMVMLGGILVIFGVNSFLRRRRARNGDPEVLRRETIGRLRPGYRPALAGHWVMGFVGAALLFSLLSLSPAMALAFSVAGLYVPALLLVMIADALVRLLVTDRYARALLGEDPPAPGG